MRSFFSIARRRDSGKPPRCKALMLLVACVLALPAYGAEAPRVAVSIRPLHSLVAGVMEDIGTPTLIVSGNQSPHDFSLRPSQTRQVMEADIVFLINRNFELFLQKPLQNARDVQTVIEASGAKGITLYPARNTDNSHGAVDYHIWLNPAYAAAIVAYTAEVLAEKDPAHAAQYQRNAKRMMALLQALDKEVAKQLRNINKDTLSYLAYHDAYQYFDRHYGLPPTPAITRNPEAGLGAKSFAALQADLDNRPLRCIFSEPQFNTAVVNRLAEQYSAEVRLLNPDGSAFRDGTQAYFALIKDIARNFAECSIAKK